MGHISFEENDVKPNRMRRIDVSTLIHKGNRRLRRRGKQEPANRREIIKNLARQTDVLPIPETRGYRIFRKFMIALHYWIIFSFVFVVCASLVWFGACILKQQGSSESILLNTFAVISSIWVLWLTRDTIFYMDMAISYPDVVREMYEAIIASGEIVSGKIVSVEKLETGETEIRCNFSEPWSGKKFSSCYVTDVQKTFSVNQNVVVLFLPVSFHVAIYSAKFLPFRPTTVISVML